MNRYAWITEPDGLIRVTDDTGRTFVPVVPNGAKAIIDTGATRFGDLFRRYADMRGIDWRWLVAMGYQESKFDPRETHPEPDGRLGVGLFQITDGGLKGKYSDEQLKDPELNTKIASAYIQELAKRYGKDFPKVSAAFNAGSVRKSDRNAWGMHCTGFPNGSCHVDHEVQALNYLVLRERPKLLVPSDTEILAQVYVTGTAALETDAHGNGV